MEEYDNKCKEIEQLQAENAEYRQANEEWKDMYEKSVKEVEELKNEIWGLGIENKAIKKCKKLFEESLNHISKIKMRTKILQLLEELENI